MRRLCVFHKAAFEWAGGRVEWVICRACLRELARGKLAELMCVALHEGYRRKAL